MKLISRQTTLLTRLILALTLLFIIPVGLASAIGSTISAPLISFIVTKVGANQTTVKHLHLLDMRSNLIAKIHDDAIVFTALWSPDGTQLLYTNLSNQAFVWDMSSMDSQPLDALVTSGAIMGWSTDSRTILIRIFQDETYNLYLVAVDEGDFKKLPIPNDDFEIREDAALSPDGRFVVFTGIDQESDSEIYRFDIDENRLRQLTDNPAAYNFSVRFSPDGRQIAYRAFYLRGFMELLVMNADGSDQRQLTSEGNVGEKPEWSPDGAQLLFRAADIVTAAKTLHIIHADGTGQRKLIDYTTGFGKYSWSPDGEYVLYESDVYSLKSELYLIPTEGGEPRLLYGKDFEWVSFSSWQPQTEP
jgi:dipeptidyl aminopeptidase/acylaminoacyl peptidase